MYGLCCCRAVSAAVRPLCAVGLLGSCQAVTLRPDSDGTPRLSDSAVRLSDTCCQTVRESAVSAVRLSGTVRRCPGFAVRLSDQGSASRGRLVRVRRSRAPRPARAGRVDQWSQVGVGAPAAAVSIKSKIEGLQKLARPGSSRRGSPELCPFLVDVLVPAVVHVLRAAAPTLQPRLRRVLRHEVNKIGRASCRERV